MKQHLTVLTLSLAAAALLATAPAEAAKRKRTKAPAQTYAKTYESTYYYQGTGTHALHDRARPFFGSPVRGREFFEAQTSGQ